MKIAVLSSFFVYLAAFGVLQQIIGRKLGVRNVPRKDYLMFEPYLAVSLTLVIVGLYTMESWNLTTFGILRISGGAVVAIGLFISMWSQVVLGRFWVGGIGIHKNHRLITWGPYRYVRHPLYAGMLLSAVGLCLMSLNVFYGLGSLVFSGAYALRAFHEDKLLRKKFKTRFDAYEASTNMIVPSIRKRKS